MNEYNITIRCYPRDLAEAIDDIRDAFDAIQSWGIKVRGMDHESDEWMWTLDLEHDDGGAA